MKKNNFKFALVAVLSLAFLAACKKGENDPFLSLKSRNARITGTWKLKSAEITNSNVYGGTTQSLSTSFDGTNMTETLDSGESDTYSYSQTVEINKDGTYKMTLVEDGITSDYQGNWWWIDSNKKKVRIAFDDDFGSFYIDRLKNKEMVWKIDESSSSVDYSSKMSGTWTFEKE